MAPANGGPSGSRGGQSAGGSAAADAGAGGGVSGSSSTAGASGGSVAMGGMAGAAGSTAGLGGMLGGAGGQAAETRPNVLVVMLDDMGYSDLGTYGGLVAAQPSRVTTMVKAWNVWAKHVGVPAARLLAEQ